MFHLQGDLKALQHMATSSVSQWISALKCAWHLLWLQASAFLYRGSTSLYTIYTTMALLAWLYLTLHHDFTWLYLSVLHSTIAQLGSTCLHYPLPWLNILGSILDPTWLYHDSTLLYLTLLQSTMSLLGSTWPNFTVLHSAMVLLSSTWLYVTLLPSTMALLDYTTLYHGFTWLYLTLLHSTMALLCSTWLYYTLPWLLGYTWLFYTLPCLYLTLPDSTTL